MIKLEDINTDSWKDILNSNSPDDAETIKFLHEHEEDILNILIEDGGEKTLDKKRIEYIRNILSDNSYETDVEEVIKRIDEIRQNNGYSILQFGKRLPGSSYTVFEFGDKVIKLGKYYRVLNDPNILQPEFQMSFGKQNHFMTVYERVQKVYTENDKEIAQELYNRIRDNGILWFDVIGYNVGRTTNHRDENDDGLRIIDAQYMEYERDLLISIDPERNEVYRDKGPSMYSLAIRDYIMDHGHMDKERKYQEMVEEKRKKATKQEVEIVAKQSSIKGIQKIKEFFSNIFHRKENNEREGK